MTTCGVRQWGRLWLACWAVVTLLTGCWGFGDDDNDEAAAAPVAVAPVLLTQPSDAQAVAGGDARFTAAAQGTSVTWAWQRSTDSGSTWLPVANASTASLALTGVTLADTNTRYRAVASSAGLQTFSSAALLTVSAAPEPPRITVELNPQSVLTGSSVSFAVTATGTALQYQWQSSRDGSTWVDVAAATSATLQLQSVAFDANGTVYRVVVRNTLTSVTSAAVLLTVSEPPAAPAVTLQPLAVSVTAPNTATFTAAASGRPAPALQWQRSTNNGVTYADIAGANLASYTTAATALADTGTLYRLVASNSVSTATSSAAVLTVSPTPAPPVASTQPADTTVLVGQTATFTAAFSGVPTPTLQWQFSADAGATFANINGATGSSYSAVVALGDSGKRYRVVATNTHGSATSQSASLLVTPAAGTLVGRSWSAGQPLEENNTALPVTRYQSAIDDAGRVMVVFRKEVGGRHVFLATRGLPNANGSAPSWSEPVQISGNTSVSQSAWLLQVANAPGGDAVALWNGEAACTAGTYAGAAARFNCQYYYFARYRAATDTWDAPSILTDSDSNDGFEILTNDRGDLAFVGPSWVTGASLGVTLPWVRVKAIFTRGNGQTTFVRQVLSTDSPSPFETVKLDMDAAGNLLMAAKVRRNSIADIVAYRGTAATGLGDAIDLEDRPLDATLVSARVGRNGQQVVVWLYPNDTTFRTYAAASASSVQPFSSEIIAQSWLGSELVVTDDGEAVVFSIGGDGRTRLSWTAQSGWRRWLANTNGDSVRSFLTQSEVSVSRNGLVLGVDVFGTTFGMDVRKVDPDISPTSPVGSRFAVGYSEGSLLPGKPLVSVSGIGFVPLLNDFVVLPTPQSRAGVVQSAPHLPDEHAQLWGLFLK